MAALTPRQEQIKTLLDEGKSPAEIAKRLRITRNAVYQQKRRIEAGGGASRRSSGGRQSSRTARRATAHRPTAPRVPEQERPQEPVDPLTATKERLAAVKIEHRNAERQRDEAIKALDSLDAEVKRLEQAEAVLSGKSTASKSSQGKPRSSRQRPAQRANGATSEGDGKPEAAQHVEAAQTPSDPTVESAAAEERTEAASTS